MDRNEIEIVLPHEGFTNVARLVTGGFLARRSYPYETIDDLQLAIELVLRSLPVRGEQVTIRLASDAERTHGQRRCVRGGTRSSGAARGRPATGSSSRAPARAARRQRRARDGGLTGARAAQGARGGRGVRSSSVVRRRRPTGARCCAPSASDGDLAARDALIEDFMPLVRSIARRYAGRGELLDDLEQVASVGLIKAIERFDLDRDVELMTYVFPTVVGELKRHFRDRVWSVTVPRRLKELHFRLSRLLEELTAIARPLADDRRARRGGRRRARRRSSRRSRSAAPTRPAR